MLVRGESVGRYVVISKIGAGGMGVVYAAYDPELDRKVALKIIHRQSDFAASTAPAQARLLREAQALAQLSHPNVVAVHDVGPHEGQVFLAMEFVEGETLAGWLAAAPRRWREERRPRTFRALSAPRRGRGETTGRARRGGLGRARRGETELNRRSIASGVRATLAPGQKVA